MEIETAGKLHIGTLAVTWGVKGDWPTEPVQLPRYPNSPSWGFELMALDPSTGIVEMSPKPVVCFLFPL
jgi:hypothetical protein